jgi:hypothetical protein
LAKVLKDVSTAKEVNRQCDSFIFPICGIWLNAKHVDQ